MDTSVLVGLIIGGFVVSLVVLYIAFQRHCLPPACGRYVARLFFYPTLPLTLCGARCCGQRRRPWHQFHPRVWLGIVPACCGHVADLAREPVNCRAVISLCDEYTPDVQEYRDLGITGGVLHLPTIDHTEPSLSDLWVAVRFIEDFIRANPSPSDGSVYIHCKGGHGRSAAVAFAWLLYSDASLTPETAQQHLTQVRKVRKTLHKQLNLHQFWLDVCRRRGMSASVGMPASDSSDGQWASPRATGNATRTGAAGFVADARKVNSSGYAPVSHQY